MNTSFSINPEQALNHLLDLLAVPGPSGREGAVAQLVRDKLAAAGCKPSWMRHDQAHRQLEGFEIGNLIVKIPGTARGPRILFMGHMDTVPLCRGAVPVRRGKRIVPKGSTGLGADNRTAVAALVILAETLLKSESPRPPITLLFSVGEEIGLLGAGLAKVADLGSPAMAFNIDSGNPAELIVGAIGAQRLTIEVIGRSSHAGVHPEHGISATLIASRAIADIARRGFFGKIVKRGRRGTSNVGVIQGGEATNQVTDRVVLKAEARSHDPSFVDEIVAVYRAAFDKAAASVLDHKGRSGKVVFVAHKDYSAFRLPEDCPVVRHAEQAAKAIGLRPVCKVVDGGLDANPMNQKGIPTVTLGAGQHNPHTVDEYVDIDQYLRGCALLIEVARQAAG